MLKLAFIGGWGHHYLRAAVGDAACGIEAVAVAGDGRDDAAARRMAEQLPAAAWFDAPEAMLDTFAPDVVSVGAVYGHNADMIALALQRDIPVISDKPVAATWAQLDRLESLLRDPGRVLITEFDFRSRPCFRAARQAVLDGRIGTPVLAVAQKSYRFGSRPPWYADREAYGGTMLWIASHGIDAIRFVTDRPMLRVRGQGGNLSRPQMGAFDDHVAAMFELEGGGCGIVHADLLRPAAAATHGDDRLRVAGTAGLLEIHSDRCALTTNDQPTRDITDEVNVEPLHRELLTAACEGGSLWYHTAASLELAAVMLAARDAADQRRPVVIERRNSHERPTP
jgi:predicted dehydrogenase